MAQGKAEGKAEGIAQGRTEGILEGKLSVAKNLVDTGMSLDQISIVTGLPIEEIQKILN